MSNNKLLFKLIYYSHAIPYNYHIFTITYAYENRPTIKYPLGPINTRMDKHTHNQKIILTFFISNHVILYKIIFIL